MYKPPKWSDPNQSSVKCPKPIQVTAIEGLPLQDNLKRALEKTVSAATGCDIKVSFLEMGKFMQDYGKAASDIYVNGLDTNSTDPLGFYRSFIFNDSENFLKYNSPQLSRLFDKLDDVLPEKRQISDYEKLQKEFYAAGFGVAMGHPNFKFVYSKDVKTVHMNPLGMHFNRWWKIGRSQ